MDIQIYDHLYYRGDDHIPRRITIVDRYEKPGFFWAVNGHMSAEEIAEKKPERFLIHRNRITM